MDRILVTGGSGFLGSRICRYFMEAKKGEVQVFAPSHREMDFTDMESARAYILRSRPHLVFHCGGVSDTEYTRTHPEESFCINVEGTRNLARITGELNIPMIFTSSDYVYQGKTIAGKKYDEKVDAFREEDACPEHEYGRQKLEAEKACLACNPLGVALRLTWMYDLPERMWGGELRAEETTGHMQHGDELLPIKQNLLTNLLRAQERNQPIAFARHEYRGITNVWDVVKNLEKASKLPPGIYNFGCDNALPTIEVARMAAKILGISPALIVEDEQRFAHRPRNITMSMAKLKKQGIDFGSTIEGIKNWNRSKA